MRNIVVIDPVTRIEGHLSVRVEVEGGRVVKAYSSGEMFRGFEAILKGRSPLDAHQITQRICGVCPVSHGLASVLAQDMAYGASVPQNGILLRNLIQGANFIQSHITHFYLLSALDFIDITAVKAYQGKDSLLREVKAWVQSELASNSLYPVAPFSPSYSGDLIQDPELNILALRHYLDALEMRSLAHKMGAVFGGKLPHCATLIPGGITEKVTTDKIAACRSMLKRLKTFISDAYLPDVLEVARAFPKYFQIGKGCANFLSYGVFPEATEEGSRFIPSGILRGGRIEDFDEAKISEEIRYAFYSSPSGLHPAKGQTTPDAVKYDAYSWIKAPRYEGTVVEVGPLARAMIAMARPGGAELKGMLDAALAKLGRKPEDLVSAMGRHAVRAIECKAVADRCQAWIDMLIPGQQAFRDFETPARSAGTGLTEAPRGALGHWLQIDKGIIENYQCVVPTTWNCSPRDDNGSPGPVEQALVGIPVADTASPVEAARVVRSFDPCIACAVH